MPACVDTVPIGLKKQRTVVVCVCYDDAFEWCVENNWEWTDEDGNTTPVKIVERAYDY